MPHAASTNNYIVGNHHITRTVLTLHTAVPQSYNILHRMHVLLGIDVIHAVNGTYTMVNSTIAPCPNLEWYSNSFLSYGIEDWSWVAVCQLVCALQEFEDDKNAKELPLD